MLIDRLQHQAHPPRRICRSTLLNKTTNITKAPLFSRADRRGRLDAIGKPKKR
jgi:hypothetical protein